MKLFDNIHITRKYLIVEDYIIAYIFVMVFSQKMTNFKYWLLSSFEKNFIYTQNLQKIYHMTSRFVCKTCSEYVPGVRCRRK